MFSFVLSLPCRVVPYPIAFFNLRLLVKLTFTDLCKKERLTADAMRVTTSAFPQASIPPIDRLIPSLRLSAPLSSSFFEPSIASLKVRFPLNEPRSQPNYCVLLVFVLQWWKPYCYLFTSFYSFSPLQNN